MKIPANIRDIIDKEECTNSQQHQKTESQIALMWVQNTLDDETIIVDNFMKKTLGIFLKSKSCNCSYRQTYTLEM